MADPLTCIVDEDIKSLLFLQEALAEVSHGSQVCQIQLHVKDVKTVTLELDLPHGLLSLVYISASDNDSGAPHCKSNSCLFANARISACEVGNGQKQ